MSVCCNTANSMSNHLFFGSYLSVSLSNLHRFHIGGLRADSDNALHIYSAGGLGGFWLDPICVNLLVLSALSPLWYASEIRQWYYCKRIDLPRGEGRIYREREGERGGNTHKDGNGLTQIGPHTPEREGKKIRSWQWDCAVCSALMAARSAAHRH